ncbi:MAG: FRG domain-containing protein [Planctomycetes bacterium]|nr:FRG domain-containing protein [Planctomycetota bacterium]
MNRQINQIEVVDTASLLSGIRKVCPNVGLTTEWYRGHSCDSWTLVPSVHRKFDAMDETFLVHRFKLEAPMRHGRLPAQDDLGGWLCLMQHYGLPTRLLDWTASLQAALYFAASFDPKPGPAAIWVLSPVNLNKDHFDGIAVMSGPQADPLVKAAFDRGPRTDTALAALGEESDIRMTVQQGAYTIHGDNTPLEDRGNADKYLVKLVIPEQARATFSEELRILGIRRASLFPDLHNLAIDLANDPRIGPSARAGLPAAARRAGLAEAR